MCIFEVATERQGGVCMGITSPSYHEHQAAVVWVEADKLLTLWQNQTRVLGGNDKLPWGSPETWSEDQKYNERKLIFNKSFHGLNNPVELPFWMCAIEPVKKEVKVRRFFYSRVVGHTTHEICYAAPTDGRTRTLWLLIAGARRFPVEINNLKTAQQLYEYAGIAGNPPQTIQNIWSEI